jgi:hypothetical protein
VNSTNIDQQRLMQESALRGAGRILSEQKYKKYCAEGDLLIEDDETRWATGVVMENLNQWMSSMSEATRAQHVGDFQKYAFPLVRAIFPELAANSLVSVQPMMGPTSMIFYLDFVRGSTKGNINRGDPAFSSIGRGPSNGNYASPVVEQELLGTTDVNGAAQGNVAYGPIVPRTVVVTDGTNTSVDDGSGVLQGGITGTVNYRSGQIAVTGALATTGVLVDYHFDMEGPNNAGDANNIPQMDLMLQSIPVQAMPKKLRQVWSLEAGFNLRALHGLEAEVELTAATGAEIRFEIDRTIINDLQRVAGAGSVFWNKDWHTVQNTAVSWTEHKLSFIDALVTGNNLIHRATGRATATWILCGQNVASVIETLPGFVPTPGMPSGLMKGVVNIGTLGGRWAVFKDPYYDVDSWLMGFKGNSFLEAGYVYAPYIPLYTTPTIVLDDTMGRKALGTHFGKRPVNPLFYVTGQIASSAVIAANTTYATDADTPTHGSADVGVFGGPTPATT